LVSPAVAQTVARETGAATAVLDPIEGLTDASAGRDYLQVMRSNLAVLEKGQSCS
jgi:zinc transport system substrate-binding protein